MKKQVNNKLIAVCLFLLALIWWWHSWNFNDRFVVGEYVSKTAGECNLIELKDDHTFDQWLFHGDRSSTRANGTWRRFGEAGMAFSTSFLGAAPAEIKSNNVYGMLDNTFGFHTLTIAPQTDPITFRKRFVHRRTCAW